VRIEAPTIVYHRFDMSAKRPPNIGILAITWATFTSHYTHLHI
jgi:hypothetical protein